MAENVRLAFQGIFSHKLRSFLTMLGVIIGIAAIIAIVSTIQGTNEQIMKNLIGSGNNTVTISLRQGDSEYYMDMGIPAGIQVISEEQKEQIRSLDKAAAASFYVTRPYVEGVISSYGTLTGARAYGIDSEFLTTCGYEVYAGRPFTENDSRRFNKVLLLDETAAGVLFPERSAIGQTVEIRSEPFTVIGLIRKSDRFQPVIESYEDYITYSQDENGMILMPYACWPVIFLYDEPPDCVVRAVRTEDMSFVGRDAERLMNQCITGSTDISYKAEDLLEKARNKQELSASTNNLLIWVASIALLVGGIGVMNIMLVSVTERTREIGIRKAIGALKGDIILQFLIESVILSLLGGIIGMAISWGVLSTINRLYPDYHFAVTPTVASVSLGFSFMVGVIFGIYPANKAANLKPINALRYE